MNHELIEKITHAVLYEGYVLYAYRPAVKNHHRPTVAGLFPQDYTSVNGNDDSAFLETQCVVIGNESTALDSRVRFLHLMDRKVGQIRNTRIEFVDSLAVGNKKYQAWQEAVEREVTVGTLSFGELADNPITQSFTFPSSSNREEIIGENGKAVGVLIREQCELEGMIKLSVKQVAVGVFVISMRVWNWTHLGSDRSMPRDQALLRAFCSAHVVLGVTGGEFVSMTAPPAQYQQVVAGCTNIRAWPVLIGEPGATDSVLAAPITLYDYPQIARQSPGDLFDATKIDEIFSPGVETLTDREKIDALALDERISEMPEPIDTVEIEHLMDQQEIAQAAGPLSAAELFPELDGPSAAQSVPNSQPGVSHLRVGDRVRLRPYGAVDPLDMLINGKVARIAAIEQDFDGKIHLAVVVEDDPGVAINRRHRFFFRPDEVELIA
jgi:hypothetical protein